ncbi:unnamed protein product [Ophioblennius macclurei]
MNKADVESVDVELVDAVETVEDLLNSPEEFRAEDMGITGLDELNDLFGIEDLKWTLDTGSSSPSFNMEFSDFDGPGGGHDSNLEASTASSPERMPRDSKMRSRQFPSSHGINKNAIAARLNRLRKKEYVSSLEKKVNGLATENGALRQENCQLTKRVEELEDETRRPAPTTMTMPSPGSA